MRIFLTGGTGFIGTHFLRADELAGHSVLALRRDESSRPRLTVRDGIEWLTCPLNELQSEHIVGCEVLVHLASPGVSPKKAEWNELLRWNVDETLRLVKTAKIAGVRRIVVAGSFAEYGRSADRFDPIPPDAPLEPTTAYGASKAAGSVALFAFAVEEVVELAYLRVFSAFGEGQYEGNFWPALRTAAMAGNDFEMTAGEQVRDYQAVEEVAAAFWRAATKSVIVPGNPLVANLGTGSPVSMREFAKEWWMRFNATGKLRIGALPYRPNEVMRFVPKVGQI